jgi:eukaryotic-like serine/threonine-protein kinase
MSQEAGIVAPSANDVRTGKPAGTTGTPPAKVAGPATRNRGSAQGQLAAQASEAQEHGIGGLVPPAVTCKDKMFLAKQFCVYTECQKPAFQNFPSCVRLREDAKLREATKYGN